MAKSDKYSDKLVFIVGMPRSGTTLIEQMLDSHRHVYGAGERFDIHELAHIFLPRLLGTNEKYPSYVSILDRDYLNKGVEKYFSTLIPLAKESLRITDKMPQNFMHLGLIYQLFPRARVIHCIRNPLDTCLSIFFQNFSRAHPYSFNLENTGHYYCQYYRFMQYLKKKSPILIKDVLYSDLVNNPEVSTRELVDFIDLEWDEQCLQFYKSKRIASTASHDQVREKIYTSSLNRWEHYEEHIEKLKEVLVAGGVPF